MFTKERLEKMAKQDLVSMIMLLQANGMTPMVDEKKGTEVIEDFTWNSPQGHKIVKINGKKFKIFYDNSNGSPLGFNYKFSASVMEDSGKWAYVAEKKDIGYKTVSYVSDHDERKADAIKFIDAMQKHLEKIYA